MVSAVRALHITASGALLLLFGSSLSIVITLASAFPSLLAAPAYFSSDREWRSDLISLILFFVVSLNFFGDEDLFFLSLLCVVSDLGSELDFLPITLLFVVSLACGEFGLLSLDLLILFNLVMSLYFGGVVDLLSLTLFFAIALDFFDFLPLALSFVRIRISSRSAQPKLLAVFLPRLSLAAAKFLNIAALV